EAVGPPVTQPVFCLGANREGHTLFRHFAIAADGMTELVDIDRIAVSGQSLFIALKRPVTENAITGQLHAQAEGDLVTGVFRRFILSDNERVLSGADKAPDVCFPNSFLEQRAGPMLHGKGVVYPKSCG